MSECKHVYDSKYGRKYCFKCDTDYIDILKQENADLRAKLDVAEKELRNIKFISVREEDLKREYDMPYKVTKLSLLEKHDELSKKVRQLEELIDITVAAINSLYDTLKLQFNDVVSKNTELLEKIERLESSLIEHEIAGNQLTGDVYRLESQVAVMRGALETAGIRLYELAEFNQMPVPREEHAKIVEATYEVISVVQEALSTTSAEAGQKLQELEKYAELGRLAINFDECFCPCKYGSEECGVYDCSDSLQVFCQKRAELLAEVPK